METSVVKESKTLKDSKWIGTALSIFFPCFGFVWAGQYKRGALWLLGLTTSAVLALALLATASVPAWVVFLFVILALGIQLFSYVKSYQRGRMTLKNWAILLAYGLTYYFAPLPTFFIAQAFRISSESMAPTLLGSAKNGQGDRVIANKLSYLLSDPKRGDVIVFDTSKVPNLAKIQGPGFWTYFTFRVIGLPGEDIEIRDGKIFANNHELGPEDWVPPISYVTAEDLSIPSPRTNVSTLEADEYLVLGDNSANAFDSRFWGGVPSAAIVGKVTRVYYPLSRLNSPLFPEEATSQSDLIP
ncbi:signal peptidase I, putative [Verrucomicrobiia bacterium DG1235]|nr:signal peptidase I, putative [Verrucomicrobiae bacterium DG1235]